jgi:hypothetical protein
MHDTDDAHAAFLADVRAVLTELDPVPAEVVAAAKASLTWRTIDAELAELVDDSVLAPTAAIRGPGDSRLLTFEAPTVTVVVEVTDVGEERRILGQLVTPRQAQVDVRHSGGTWTVESDELGRFSVEAVPPGPVSFVCHTGPHQSVVTSWVTV